MSAGAAAGALALLITVIVVSLSVARSREAALLREVQQSNAWGARLVAVSYLWQLEKFGMVVADLASDPELARLLEADDIGAGQVFLDSAAKNLSEAETLMILDADGRPLSRIPTVPNLRKWNYAYRDYFQGARRHVGVRGINAVHVSRVFTSTLDGLSKFTLSTAIWAGDPQNPRLLGVLNVDLTTSSTIGLLTQLSDGRREWALAGRAEKDGSSGEPRYQILIHPSYRRKESAVFIQGDRIRSILPPDPSQPELRLPAADSPLDRPPVEQDEYIDSVADQHGDSSRYLAVFAPIGNTEHVAIVQQRYDLAIEPNKTLTSRMTWWGAAAFSLGAGIAALAAVYDRRRAALRRRLGR